MERGSDQPTASYHGTYPSHPRIKKATIRRAPRASTDSRHSDCVPPDCPRVFHRRTHGTNNGPRPLRAERRGARPCGRRRCAAARRSARRARGARREPGNSPRVSGRGRRGGDVRGEGDASSHQSIRVVDSDDEPAGWPGTDPCTSDDGAARTSTSAFAEGCVAVDAREVARSIAAELLTKRAHDRRDVFSVRRSGTDASSAHVSSDDFEFDPEVGTGAESGGDTVTEPDETTSLLESVSCRTRRTGTREFGVNTTTRRRRRTSTTTRGDARDGGAVDRVRRRRVHALRPGPDERRGRSGRTQLARTSRRRGPRPRRRERGTDGESDEDEDGGESPGL